MPSRLLRELEARIAKCRDPLQATCLRAEKAALLARQGHLEQARAELTAIHARYDRQPNAVVSAWVSLAEGLIFYFNDFGVASVDKIKRSLALSEAVRARPIQALSAAWLAQMNFSRLDFGPMSKHLQIALRTAEPDQHSALSRACLVAAGAYHWAERIELALPWYGRARQHASAEGDETTLSALMHNMAWLRAAEARRHSVAGLLAPNQTLQAHLNAASVHSFDKLIGMAGLGSLVPILRAQVLILADQFGDALALLEANIEGAVSEGLERMECVMLADVAWCRWNIGDTGSARRDCEAALAKIIDETQVDDLAMTHSRLARIYAAMGSTDTANAHASQADQAWQTHSERQALLVPTLALALEGL